jgi:hypothetical protein
MASSKKSLHRYEDSCRTEARHAQTLDRWLGQHYRLRLANVDEQRQGIDRVVIDDDGCDTTIDYKCDTRAAQTGNLFAETVSNARTGRLGWALTSRAEWLFYFVVPARVQVYRMARFRAAVAVWNGTYPLRAAENEGYATLGICVPLEVAAARAEYVAHLDADDGPVLQRRLRLEF